MIVKNNSSNNYYKQTEKIQNSIMIYIVIRKPFTPTTKKNFEVSS